MNFASREGKPSSLIEATSEVLPNDVERSGERGAILCPWGEFVFFVRTELQAARSDCFARGNQTDMLQTKSMTGTKISAPIHLSKRQVCSNIYSFLAGAFVLAFWKLRPVGLRLHHRCVFQRTVRFQIVFSLIPISFIACSKRRRSSLSIGRLQNRSIRR